MPGLPWSDRKDAEGVRGELSEVMDICRHFWSSNRGKGWICEPLPALVSFVHLSVCLSFVLALSRLHLSGFHIYNRRVDLSTRKLFGYGVLPVAVF